MTEKFFRARHSLRVTLPFRLEVFNQSWITFRKTLLRDLGSVDGAKHVRCEGETVSPEAPRSSRGSDTSDIAQSWAEAPFTLELLGSCAMGGGVQYLLREYCDRSI